MEMQKIHGIIKTMKFLLARELKEYKKSLSLTQIQKNLIIGAMLGDGNLRIIGRNREASFAVDHSNHQKEYVLWKYGIMSEWVTTKPKILTRIYHKNPKRLLTSLRFQTISHPEFSFWHKVFYPEGIKIVPKNIQEILVSPLSLAIWFMDDGNKNHQAVFLNTQQFEKYDQECLMECLNQNFGLECTLNKHWMYKGKQLYRIRVSTKSTRVLHTLVEEYLLPSMQYKIPSVPVTTSLQVAKR